MIILLARHRPKQEGTPRQGEAGEGRKRPEEDRPRATHGSECIARSRAVSWWGEREGDPWRAWARPDSRGRLSHEADAFEQQVTVVVERGPVADRAARAQRRVLVVLGSVAAVLGVVAVVLLVRDASSAEEGSGTGAVAVRGEDALQEEATDEAHREREAADAEPPDADLATPQPRAAAQEVRPAPRRSTPTRASTAPRVTRATYNDARAGALKAMDTRGIRRGDDDELDRALRAMQRAARQKRWAEAVEAAGKVDRRAEALRVDKAFVLQKLSRYNRAYDAVKDDGVKQALTRLSGDISRALQEGRFDDANRLINQGSDRARKGR